MIQIIGRPKNIKAEDIISAVEGYTCTDGTVFKMVTIDFNPNHSNMSGNMTSGFQDTIIERDAGGRMKIINGDAGAGSAFWEQSPLTGRFFARVAKTAHNLEVLAKTFDTDQWTIREKDVRVEAEKLHAEFIEKQKTTMVSYMEDGEEACNADGSPKLVSLYDLRTMRKNDGRRKNEKNIQQVAKKSEFGNASLMDVTRDLVNKETLLEESRRELDTVRLEAAAMKQKLIEAGILKPEGKYKKDEMLSKDFQMSALRKILVEEFSIATKEEAGNWTREVMVNKIIDAQESGSINRIDHV